MEALIPHLDTFYFFGPSASSAIYRWPFSSPALRPAQESLIIRLRVRRINLFFSVEAFIKPTFYLRLTEPILFNLVFIFAHHHFGGSHTWMEFILFIAWSLACIIRAWDTGYSTGFRISLPSLG